MGTTQNGPGHQSAFPPTQWSVILHAGRTDSPEVAYALERLCRLYWYPLYAFARRQGESPPDAEDVTQSFFVHLFENDLLRQVDREKGRFRSFLLAAFTNFLRNQWDRRAAKKRGGAHEIVPLETSRAEETYSHETATHLNPPQLFDRRWAQTLVEAALARLQHEHELAGKQDLFHQMKEYLTRETDAQFYAQRAQDLNISAGAAKVAMHRLRRRFGTLLRSEVAYTVAAPEEVEEELRHLLATIGE